jgi:hypothetical protein
VPEHLTWADYDGVLNLDPPHRSAELAHPVFQQVSVRGVVNTGFNHSRVNAEFAAPNELVLDQLAQQCGVDVFDGPRAAAADQFDQRGLRFTDRGRLGDRAVGTRGHLA